MNRFNLLILFWTFLLISGNVWASGKNSEFSSQQVQVQQVKSSATTGTGETPELVIGEERVEPGIIFIFEGAIKDTIYPMAHHLQEMSSNVHLEARANWAEKNIPTGTPPGGFVAYLEMTAEVVNQSNGLKIFVDLLPHVNLIDNLHYARNIQLPGKASDKYTVAFTITSSTGKSHVSLHKDWKENYGDSLMKSSKFVYKDVDFSQIANARRS